MDLDEAKKMVQNMMNQRAKRVVSIEDPPDQFTEEEFEKTCEELGLIEVDEGCVEDDEEFFSRLSI